MPTSVMLLRLKIGQKFSRVFFFWTAVCCFYPDYLFTLQFIFYASRNPAPLFHFKINLNRIIRNGEHSNKLNALQEFVTE